MLRGKNVVVTGSNRGIGLAVTRACARYGATVWACMRSLADDNLERMGQISGEFGVSVRPVRLDLASPESVAEAAAAILAEKVPVDALVNNAGVTGNGRLFSMTSMGEVKDVFEVNFFGPMLLTQKLIKNMMRHRNGSVVNIASVAAFDGRPAQLEYVASKAAVVGASRRLAAELGAFGIRVNAIAPGVTETDMLDSMAKAAFDTAMANSFLKRPASPEDVAEAAAFLISDRSRYITGQVLRVDGGGN